MLSAFLRTGPRKKSRRRSGGFASSVMNRSFNFEQSSTCHYSMVPMNEEFGWEIPILHLIGIIGELGSYDDFSTFYYVISYV